MPDTAAPKMHPRQSFRTLVTAVLLGLAQIGFRDSGSSEPAHRVFGRILESGKLLLGIINDVLDFSKIEAGKFGLESVPVSLSQTLSLAVESMRERAGVLGERAWDW
jgi:signal transduction histidine kinase